MPRFAFLWKNKFIFWNFFALVFIKALFAYSGFQLASLVQTQPQFSRTEIVVQTNQLRSTFGLTPLKESVQLNQAAAQKLQDMMRTQYFDHFSPTGVSPWHWFVSVKYNYSLAGENLAIGFISAEDTVKAWSASPTHRANLVNAQYREIGVATAPAEINGDYGMLVVQLFGTPQPAVRSTPTSPLARPTPSPTPALIAAAPLPSPAVTFFPTPTPTVPPNFQIAQAPISVDAPGIPARITKTARYLNSAFILYSFALLLLSLIFVIFQQATRPLVVRTGLALGLVLCAVTLPVLQTLPSAWIF